MFKTDLSDMETEAKAEALDVLSAGSILFFKGHEMMCLGEMDGLHYVVSTMGSIMKPGDEATERIRGVAINTLEETMRANGTSWLKNLNLAVQPWLPASTEAVDDDNEAALSEAA